MQQTNVTSVVQSVDVVRTDSFMATATAHGLGPEEQDAIARFIAFNASSGKVIFKQCGFTWRWSHWKKDLYVHHLEEPNGRINLLCINSGEPPRDPSFWRRILGPFSEKLLIAGLVEGAKSGIRGNIELMGKNENTDRIDIFSFLPRVGIGIDPNARRTQIFDRCNADGNGDDEMTNRLFPPSLTKSAQPRRTAIPFAGSETISCEQTSRARLWSLMTRLLVCYLIARCQADFRIKGDEQHRGPPNNGRISLILASARILLDSNINAEGEELVPRMRTNSLVVLATARRRRDFVTGGQGRRLYAVAASRSLPHRATVTSLVGGERREHSPRTPVCEVELTSPRVWARRSRSSSVGDRARIKSITMRPSRNTFSRDRELVECD